MKTVEIKDIKWEEYTRNWSKSNLYRVWIDNDKKHFDGQTRPVLKSAYIYDNYSKVTHVVYNVPVNTRRAKLLKELGIKNDASVGVHFFYLREIQKWSENEIKCHHNTDLKGGKNYFVKDAKIVDFQE